MSITIHRGTPLADLLFGTFGPDWLAGRGGGDALFGDGAPVTAADGAALVLAGGDDLLGGGAATTRSGARPRSRRPSGSR